MKIVKNSKIEHAPEPFNCEKICVDLLKLDDLLVNITKVDGQESGQYIEEHDAIGAAMQIVNEHNALDEAVKTIPRLLGVIQQLMPGIGKISCEDYAEINDAPIAANKAIAQIAVIRKMVQP
jgi:hypothetical protein